MKKSLEPLPRTPQGTKRNPLWHWMRGLCRQYAWKRALVRWFDGSGTSSVVRSQSRRRGISWNTAEQKIRKLHRAALDEITEEQSRRLYSLELSASRHAGESPRYLLEQAKRVIR